MSPNRSLLRILAQSAQEAIESWNDECNRVFPPGSQAMAVIRYGQTTPSPVTIVGPWRVGYVRVSINRGSVFNRWGKGKSVNVSVEAIVNVVPRG